MYNTDLNQLLATPLFMSVPAIVLILLMALTMNAVIKRERAMMIRESRHESVAQVAYMNRWRNRTTS
ncbi:MAG: hypothetical protein U1D00_00975 [Mycobacterium sp.]|nr:hypothetical protein [Mycobacterium sp.]